MADDSSVINTLTLLIADQQRRQPALITGLTELVESAARQVPGAQYAGITVASTVDGIHNAAASDRYAELLDEIQDRHADGPCVTAAWEHHTVLVDDLVDEPRWPRYRHDALAETPVRSVLAFEMFVDDGTMGALNFYSEEPRVFGHEAQELGLAFATHIALAWNMLRRSDQFSSALASRDLIGQAKGIVMERFHIDAVHAFELLRRLSQEANAKLVDVAQRIVATAQIPGDRPDAEQGVG